jgi:hypothetical protein
MIFCETGTVFEKYLNISGKCGNCCNERLKAKMGQFERNGANMNRISLTLGMEKTLQLRIK